MGAVVTQNGNKQRAKTEQWQQQKQKQQGQQEQQWEKQEWQGEKVPYHRGDKKSKFCVSKLESTTGAASYSHLDRYIFISIQTNVAQIYVP